MKKIVIRYIFILFLFLSVCSGHSQNAREYYFKHLQVEQGLSNNTAVTVIQDQKGFIWIGTKDGLNRYDGYSFKVYRNNPADSTSIGNNAIWHLHEATNGRIWVGTEHGIYSYNPADETFTHLKNTPRLQVRAIEQDAQGNLWFILNFKLYSYHAGTQTIKVHDDTTLNFCTALAITTDNQIWVGTLYGLIVQYLPETGHTTAHSVFNRSKASVSTWIERIYDTGDGNLFIGTATQGVKKFNIADASYKDILTYNSDNTEIYARDFLKLKENEYWIATESGIYIYNAMTDQTVNLKKDHQNSYALTDNAIYSFCKDKEGGVWIGTYFGGINYFPNENLVFQKYFPEAKPGYISGNAVREIIADNNNNLWIGTEDAGLNKFDPVTGKFTGFKPRSDGSGIAHTNIHGLLYSDNQLWIGTFEHGLNIMDLSTNRIIAHFTAASGANTLRSNFIHSLYKTTDGRIWIGSSNGIYYYNKTENNFISPGYFPGSGFYSSILEAKDGTIWAGTFQKGVHYYNPTENIYGQLKVVIDGKDRLTEDRVTYLYESTDGALWIATEDGLYQVDLVKKKLKIHTTATGLPSNLIYTISQDASHRYWVSTSKGLVLLDEKAQALQTFTQTNGLLSNQFNYSSFFKSKDGKFYYGSVKGMISFDPTTLKHNDYTPPVYITNFSVFNTPLSVSATNGPLYRSILLTDNITLPYNRSTFNVDFAAINFTSPDNVVYAYKLDGLDKDWNYIKTNRSVYFTDLPPGEYIFRVRSTNSTGAWKNNERTLKIIITPPLWKTAWAYLFYMVAFGLGLYYIISTYKKYLQNKQARKMELYMLQKEKELIESKIDFFTKVAHEIRTPLTLIRAPLEKINKQIDKTPQTEKYLNSMNKNTERLLELTNQLLDFRKVESKQFSLTLESVAVPELLQSIWNSFLPTAESKNIQFTLSAPNKHFRATIDADAFTKIISNLLDNAIKYSSTMVVTELMPPDEHGLFTIRVRNDGDAIPEVDQERIFELFFRSKSPQAVRGSGIGLALARSLVLLHQGSLKLETNENLITFELKIPISFEQS